MAKDGLGGSRGRFCRAGLPNTPTAPLCAQAPDQPLTATPHAPSSQAGLQRAPRPVPEHPTVPDSPSFPSARNSRIPAIFPYISAR